MNYLYLRPSPFGNETATLPVGDCQYGNETKNFIKRVLNQVTVAGSLTLCIIAAIPIITPIIWTQTGNANLSLGGTGLIIVTGVALETVKQIKTYITRKEYHGYIRK